MEDDWHNDKQLPLLWTWFQINDRTATPMLLQLCKLLPPTMSFSFTSLHDRATLESMTDIVAQLSCWSVLKAINTTTWLPWSPFAILYFAPRVCETYNWHIIVNPRQLNMKQQPLYPIGIVPCPYFYCAGDLDDQGNQEDFFFLPRYKMGASTIKHHHSTFYIITHHVLCQVAFPCCSLWCCCCCSLGWCSHCCQEPLWLWSPCRQVDQWSKQGFHTSCCQGQPNHLCSS